MIDQEGEPMTTQAETSRKQELPIEVTLTDHGSVAESASR